ncbi:unnamed protein product [Choristocarpus tenellus]
MDLPDGRRVYFSSGGAEIIEPGSVHRLEGCGMPVEEDEGGDVGQGDKGHGPGWGGHRTGDLYLRFDVQFPKNEEAYAWGEEGRMALEGILPKKPRVEAHEVDKEFQLEKADTALEQHINSGAYDDPRDKQGGPEEDRPSFFSFFGM